jgi:hypothetical protein
MTAVVASDDDMQGATGVIAIAVTHKNTGHMETYLEKSGVSPAGA